ncbi:MAG TPA: PAS domain-containing protein [Steroidobacteraceae bacterium]
MSVAETDVGESPLPNASLAFLQGGGEMGALIRAHDWSATSIGPPERWPAPLRTVVALLLSSHQPMYIWWGPQLLCFYNDAYRQSIGPERHPSSLGAPGREVWAEIWHIIGPQIDQVMSGGGAYSNQNALVPITRHGQVEQVYWTYCYTPIFDPNSPTGIGGALVICTETTELVLSSQRAAAQLQELAVLFEQAPTFMAMLKGPEHRFELSNPSYRQLIGYREHLGLTVAEAFPETIAQGYLALLDRVYQSGEPYTAAGRKLALQISPTGPAIQRYVDFVYQPIKDAAGAITGIFVVGVDATERSDVDAALRTSEEQLRLATDAAEIGLWDLDVLTDVLYWPPRVKAMFGISPDVAVSMADYYAGLHPEDREATGAAFAASIDSEKRALYDVEYRTVGKEDGVVRWVAAKGRGVFEGERCVRVIGTAIDITARRAAEAELRELNEQLESRVAQALAERKILADIVEATDALVQVLDLNYCYLAVNRACANEFERVFGVRPKVGDSMLELLRDRPEHQASVKAIWSRALAGAQFTAVEEFGDPKLDRRYYEIKFNSLRDRSGKLIGAFQFVYDVTDRLKDQARLAEAETHLRQVQKIDAIGQLTGGVAHDFNNLLMVISGGLSILRRPGEPERKERIMAQMSQAAARGASLSRQLLAFARRQALNPEPVNVHQQIDGMRELLDRTLRGDVVVKTEFAQDLWPIRVDPSELELVILNLCVNSRDAMPNGGVITIAGENVSERQEAELKGDFVLLSVADTGSGMSAEVLSRIFEPFFTTKEIGKGSGLGLPQVYGFAQQSGGTVKVESVVGRGTTVSMLLPRSEVAPLRPAEERSDLDTTSRRHALKGSILLVEDDDEVAALVAEMLSELGYRTTRVASAQAGLGALADDREINLVFSDVMMPGPLNGLDLAQEIRRRRPGTPILLTTGYAGAAMKKIEGEHIEILAKPYELSDLDAALRAAFAGRGKKYGSS